MHSESRETDKYGCIYQKEIDQIAKAYNNMTVKVNKDEKVIGKGERRKAVV